MAALSKDVKAYRYQLMRDYMREQQLDALAFATPDWFEWAGNHGKFKNHLLSACRTP